MTTYRTVLRFAGSPAVTGEWGAEPTARRTWRDWVGLYGSDDSVVVHLIEDTGDHEHLLTAWEHGEVIAPPESPAGPATQPDRPGGRSGGA